MPSYFESLVLEVTASCDEPTPQSGICTFDGVTVALRKGYCRVWCSSADRALCFLHAIGVGKEVMGSNPITANKPCFNNNRERHKMPRPNPPPPVVPPIAVPFTIDDSDKHELARLLGLECLPNDVSGAIATAVAGFGATRNGSSDTTVGNTLAALGELRRGSGRAYRNAVRRIAADESAVDYKTHRALQALAKAVLGRKPGAEESLANAAHSRADELKEHPRVRTSVEPLRHFCGVLRLIFCEVAAPSHRRTIDEGWRNCRRFALGVFTIAGIEPANFDAHPERFTEYLGTDVTIH
jgi:hypothetical protein